MLDVNITREGKTIFRHTLEHNRPGETTVSRRRSARESWRERQRLIREQAERDAITREMAEHFG